MCEQTTSCESETERTVLAAAIALDRLVRSAVMADRNRLTKSQMDVIMGLAVTGKMNMAQVSEQIAASKEQATRAVAPLVESGLVVRRRDLADSRSVVVGLTDEGRRVFEENTERTVALLAARLADLSDDDRARLFSAARTVVDVLRKMGGTA